MPRNMSRCTARILRALIQTLKPRKPDFDPPIEDYLMEIADNFMAALPSHMKILLPLGLYLLEFGTIIFVPTVVPFSKLSLEKRDKYLKGWSESKIPLRRDLIKGLKAICMIGYYAHPEVMKHIGYNLDQHLRKINVAGIDQPPSVACSEEAAQYFRNLDKEGKWGTTDGLPGKAREYSEG